MLDITNIVKNHRNYQSKCYINYSTIEKRVKLWIGK